MLRHRRGQKLKLKADVVRFSPLWRKGGYYEGNENGTAELITKKLKNPLITEMFSVLRVDVARDLAHAKVYISVYSGSEEAKKRTFDAIAASAKQIRFELAKVSNVRTVPELHFVEDRSMEYSDHINRLLKSVHTEEEQ